MILEHCIEATNAYIERMPKSDRKICGQFFTSKDTAIFMAGLFDYSQMGEIIRVLDPGAGSGILSCALLEEVHKHPHIKQVILTCYENNKSIIDILNSNLSYAKDELPIAFSYTIIQDNYITSQASDYNNSGSGDGKYDAIIGNPPYKKIAKNAPEALAMPLVCYGAPNLYFLFASMSAFNLRPRAEMVYIIPRSWTSGAYFKHFRKYFLHECKLNQIHLFVSRDKVFESESVLQETIIIKVQKMVLPPQFVIITSSNTSSDFNKLTSLVVPYNLVVCGDDEYVYLITCDEELAILQNVHQWNNTLPSLGLKMKTGLTVDFRNRELLRNVPETNAVPLIYSQHICDGVVEFPIHKENEYILSDRAGLLQKNKNYLFVKRFTSKEEKRRLQCGIYLAKRFPQFEMISTQNKINFIDANDGDLSDELVYGLYVLFNSTLYDRYYRILNGSTQVNSTEINAMPLPNLCLIQKMGAELLLSKDLSESNCNRILEECCE